MAKRKPANKKKPQPPLNLRKVQKGARVARAAGRAGDDHLIHVNSDELGQMHDAWGPPSVNPITGLPEYGLFSKLGKTAKFMHKHVRKVLKGGYDAMRGKGSIFGGTPIGTKLSNAVTGRHDKPITDQYGGPTGQEKADYKAKHGADSLGYSSELHQIGSTIGGWYAGGALAGQAGAAAQGLTGSQLAGNIASRATSAAVQRAAAEGASDTHGSGGNATLPISGSLSSTGGSSPGALAGTSSMPKSLKPTSYSTRDPWYTNAAADALARANTLSQRPYEAYTGQRVAGLSGNEQQASTLASQAPGQYQPMVNRLQGGFSTEALAPYMNPYTDAVLGARLRGINDTFGQQAGDLDRNAAATDAFRTGRSDLARSRLAFSKMRALDEATNEAKSGAFESAKDAYFRQGSQDISGLGAISGANNNAISALQSTGGTERQIQQAQDDFNYGQHLERRDWDMNNLNNLLSAIGAVNPAAGTFSYGKKASSAATDWGAVAGLFGSAINEYYGGGGGTGGYQSGGWSQQAADAGGS